MIKTIHMLSLDKRKEFWPKIEQDCKEILGLEINKFICGDGTDTTLKYDHIDSKDDSLWNYLVRPATHSYRMHANAFLCHKKMFTRILQTISQDEMDTKFIFLEDDIYWIKNRWNSLSEYGWDYIKNGEYDILFLGWQAKEHPNDLSDDLESVEAYWRLTGQGDIAKCTKDGPRVSGFHAVVLNGYSIAHLAQLNKGPVDSYINEYMLDMEVYYIRPKIIRSKTCFSYCEQKWQPRSQLQ